MTTIVPIEDIAEILFDNSKDIPNNIYIEFMNMLKQYHEYGDNSEQIHKYIENFEIHLQIKLKKYFYKQKINLNCYCFCNNNLTKVVIMLIFVCGIFGMIFYFKITEITEKTSDKVNITNTPAI